MSGPATRDDIAALIDAIERMAEAGKAAAADQTAIIREILETTRGGPGPVQQVTLPHSAPVSPQRSERLVWVMCIATAIMAMVAGGAVVAAVLQGQRLSDMRADYKQEVDRIERKHEQLAEWARTESNITRGYIWTGKVPIANPYPSQTEAAP